MSPYLSVVMPVFDAGPFVAEALRSILDQSFADFEVIVIDDASTDDSPAVVAALADDRVRLLRGTSNLGLASRLNEGVSLARGQLIARMDADDICAPGRFERQVRFLDAHPEIDLVGGQIRLFEDVGVERRWLPSFEVATSPAQIRFRLFFGNSIGHVTVMARKTFFEDVGGYDPTLRTAQDYDLWLRANPHHLMANLPDVLVTVRVHGSNVSRVNDQTRGENAQFSLRRSLAETLDEEVSFRTVSALMDPRSILSAESPSEVAPSVGRLVSTITDYCLGSHAWTPAQVQAIKRDAAYRLSRLLFFTARKDPALAARLLIANKHVSASSLLRSLGVASASRLRRR